MSRRQFTKNSLYLVFMHRTHAQYAQLKTLKNLVLDFILVVAA